MVDKANVDTILTHQQISDFILHNFAEIKNSNNINNLIHFHSVNKFLFMAHSQTGVGLLGKIVANHQSLPLFTILTDYEAQLEKTLTNKPTTKSHSNVLQKIFGYFKKDLTSEEKSLILEMLSNHRLVRKHLILCFCAWRS